MPRLKMYFLNWVKMMLKALLKKQLLEFFSGMFRSGKNNKNSKKGAKAGFIALIVLFVFSMSVMFSSMAYLLVPVTETEYSWVYFAVFGILASMLGIFGSVFMTYNTIYEAKDNDLLLSMPIPSGLILFVRMAGLYVTALLYEAMVLLPSLIVYCVCAPFDMSVLFISLINVLILPFFAVSVSCILGWFIALFASKIRNKGIITVVFSIAFFAVYYFAAMRFNSIINLIVLNAEAVGAAIKKYLYLFYKMSLGCNGDVFSFLLYFALVAAFFLVIYKLISKSFIKLTTAKKGMKKKIYKEKQIKISSARTAFLRKEFLYFKSTPVYMLNSALGSVLLIVFTVFIALKGESAFLLISVTNLPPELIPVIFCLVSCFIASTNNITSSSISLEAKNLWLLKSVPTDIRDIFFAKIMLHVIITGVPAIVCNAVISIVFSSGILLSILSIFFSVLFVILCAVSGLTVNLIFPKLNWTNEAVPIKQSLSATIGMFIGFVYLLVVIVTFLVTASILPAEIFLSGFSAVVAAISVLLIRRLNKKGVNQFINM